jgi:hypothetical protein
VYIEQCSYTRIDIQWVEINEGVTAVVIPDRFTEMRWNFLKYDGVEMSNGRRITRAMEPYQTHFTEIHAYFSGPFLYSAMNWGAVDGSEHTLELVVNEGPTGTNTTVGMIKIRYCRFTGEACSCGVDLTAGAGVRVANKQWDWGSTDGCVAPADVVTDETGALVRYQAIPLKSYFGICDVINRF